MKKKLLCLLMPVCLLGLAACQNSTADNSTTANSTEAVTETQTETEKETKITENRSIYNSDITYETLVKTPGENINSSVKFSGKVVQIIDSNEDGMSSVWLAVDNNYKNILIVTYKDDVINKNLLVDDKITVYGGYGGEYACNSIYGESIKLPLVFAFIIDFNN